MYVEYYSICHFKFRHTFLILSIVHVLCAVHGISIKQPGMDLTAHLLRQNQCLAQGKGINLNTSISCHENITQINRENKIKVNNARQWTASHQIGLLLSVVTQSLSDNSICIECAPGVRAWVDGGLRWEPNRVNTADGGCICGWRVARGPDHIVMIYGRDETWMSPCSNSHRDGTWCWHRTAWSPADCLSARRTQSPSHHIITLCSGSAPHPLMTLVWHISSRIGRE